MEEIWKDIPLYEGVYQVSTLGRVRSLKVSACRILKPNLLTTGYYSVKLSKDNKLRSCRVSVLVAQCFVDGYSEELLVDHEDGDTLNNAYTNLRMATHSQNGQNRAKQGNTSSKFKGVSYDKYRKRWMTGIMLNKKQIYLGRFVDEVLAAEAYDRKALELFGEFALTNKMLKLYN